MDSRDNLERLHVRRKDLLHQILGTGLFRPGTMAQQYRKCGKPNCHCAREGDPGHGPSWILTRKVHSKTVSKAIPLSELQTTQEQIATYHQFQDAIHELVETNVRICDALLESPPEETGEIKKAADAEKGGSRPNSAPQS
jgi:hypothetical protein